MDHYSELGEAGQTITRKQSRVKSSHVVDDNINQDSKKAVGEAGNGLRKKQRFEGVVRKFELFKLNILIIAEFWPSVIVGLEGKRSSKL